MYIFKGQIKSQQEVKVNYKIMHVQLCVWGGGGGGVGWGGGGCNPSIIIMSVCETIVGLLYYRSEVEWYPGSCKHH